MRYCDTQTQKDRGDDETDPAITKELFEFASVHFSSIREIVPNGFREDALGIGSIGRLAQVNDQLVRFAGGVFLGPTDNELLGLAI